MALGWLLRDTLSIVIASTELQSGSKPKPNLAVALANISNLKYQTTIDLIILLATSWLAELFAQAASTLAQHIGLKCRIATSYMVYQKSLKLQQPLDTYTGYRHKTITSLLTNETKCIEDAIGLVPKLITIPIQTAVIIFLWGYFFLGLYPTLGATVAALALFIAQGPLNQALNTVRDVLSSRVNNRVTVVNQILASIRFIKEQAWEDPFRNKIHKARRRELTMSANVWVLKAINTTIQFGASKVIAFTALIIYTTLGDAIEPDVVFVSLFVSEILRLSLTLILPYALSCRTDLVLSCHKIDKFLSEQEHEQPSPIHYLTSVDPQVSDNAIVINELFVTYEPSIEYNNPSSNSKCVIRDLNLSIRHKNLVLVVGNSGSGKSTFLLSLLGELPIDNGRIEVNGKLAFAPQDPWIFDGRIRDNIIMGDSYRQSRYDEVLRVCGLADELDKSNFPERDQTAVGAWHQTLTDSLRARINLARALYHQADIYLLDDPFAHLTSTLADDVFRDAIQTFLRNKTVVLVSSRLRYIQYASLILAFDREVPAAFGTISSIGQFEAFKRLRYKPTGELKTESEELLQSSAAKKTKKSTKRKTKPKQDDQAAECTQNAQKQPEEAEGSRQRSTSPSLSSFDQIVRELKSRDRRAAIESIHSKASKFSPYMYYVKKASNFTTATLFLSACLGAQLFYNLADYFVSLWTDWTQRRELQARSFEAINLLDNLEAWEWGGWYAIILGVLLAILVGRSLILIMLALMGSSRIHKSLIDSLIDAPVNLYDFRSMGTMLAHLNSAVYQLDEVIPSSLSNFIYSLLACGGALVIILAIDFTNIVAVLVYCSFAFQLASSCCGAIVQLRQMESSRGHLVRSHMSTTLDGLSVIKNCRAQGRFVEQFGRLLDAQTGVSFALMGSSRFLLLTTDFLTLLFVTAVICTKLFHSFEATNLSLSGLLITQTLLLPVAILLTTMQLIELESDILQVQSLSQLSQFEAENRDKQAQVLWTSGGSSATIGEIRFIELTMRYTAQDERPALNALSLTINSGEKVGIVGPQGSGKSSISAALLRLYPFESGYIEIDRIDTRRMMLSELRRFVGLVPANPRLFGGSLRENLDPFGEHSDSDLWAALEAVQLRSLCSSSPQGLDCEMEQASAKRSDRLNVIQRQLLYLARAILRRNKILVFEESTSGVDLESDIMFESIIGGYFAEATVVVVARRLQTVAGSDRVLVLDQGRLAEFGAPIELARNKSSLFSRMIESELTSEEAKRLRQTIKEIHQKRPSSSTADITWDF